MKLEEIFNEVYYEFIGGNYKVCLSNDRNYFVIDTPPKMESIEALQATVNYLIWEWSHDHEDQRFKKLIKEIAIPPKDYDLSKITFTQLLEVVSPELVKTSDIKIIYYPEITIYEYKKENTNKENDIEELFDWKEPK